MVFKDNASLYHMAGLPVIPLKKGSKIPIPKNWPNLNTVQDVNLLLDWSLEFPDSNIGLVLGAKSGVIALDIDLYRENPVERTLYEVITSIIPESPVAKIGKKGVTIFYKYSGHKNRKIQLKGKNVVELLSTGSQTVLPPSIHPETGDPYTWTGDSLLDIDICSELPELPEILIDKIQAAVKSFEESTEVREGTLSRNDTLKRQATIAIYKGKNDEEIVEELLEYDQTMHNPPLFSDPSEPQMSGKSPFDNALRFVMSIRKSLYLNNNQSNRDSRPILKLVKLSESLSKAKVETPWIVEGMLPQGGTSILVSKPKCGKSTLARQLAVAVSKGEDFLGRKTKKGPVIYLALEEREEEVSRRFQFAGAKDEDIFLSLTVNPKLALDELSREIDTLKPSLIVVDPLINFLEIENGNDYTAVYRAFKPYVDLARSNGELHLLFIHHMGKGDRDSGDATLGSTAFNAAVDTIIFLREQDRQQMLESQQRCGVRLEPTILKFDPDRQAFSLGALKHQEESKRIKSEIMELFKHDGEVIEKSIFEKKVTGQAKKIRACLNHLVEDGELLVTGSGRKGDPYKYQKPGSNKGGPEGSSSMLQAV